jgi:hypothetical protein
VRVAFTATEGFAQLYEELTPSKLPRHEGMRLQKNQWVELVLTEAIQRELQRANERKKGQGGT